MPRTTLRIAIVSLALGLAADVRTASAHPHPFFRETPDLLLTNAVVLRSASEAGDARDARTEAVLLADGAIVFCGTNAEAESLAAARLRAHPERTFERRDLGGAFVVPGLVDAHGHVAGLGFALVRVVFEGTRSADEVAGRVREAAARSPGSAWILGRGWDQNDWEKKAFPDRTTLDRVAPDRPVWLRRVDGHAGWANSKALALAGVTRETPDPEGGRILRDEQGEPTGILVDRAMGLVDSKVAAPTAEETEQALVRALEHCARLGLTGVHDAGIDSQTVEIYRRLESMQRLPVRVFAMLSDREAERASRLVRASDLEGRAMFRILGIKTYADGALGSRGAALLAPYSDEPGTSGLVVTRGERLTELGRLCLDARLQLFTHAIGDRGNRTVLDAYEAAARAKAGSAAAAAPLLEARRFRIEHAQVIAPEDIPRFAKLGVIASMQPTHCTSDMPWAPARLGASRVAGAYAWRELLVQGARLCFGSDFPVESADPRLGLYAAVTTQDADGHPAGGYRPGQRLTISEALRGFTSDAAYAAFAEDELGRIAPGMRADLTVFDRNLVRATSKEILEARCVLTIVAGRIEFEASGN
ncbi:MAG: amidohydrolase [Candidatus Eiseniibacteriota bacterium]